MFVCYVSLLIWGWKIKINILNWTEMPSIWIVTSVLAKYNLFKQTFGQNKSDSGKPESLESTCECWKNFRT